MAKNKISDDFVIAKKELIFQNEEKEKRAAELIIANKELAFQNEEKEKRAADLIIANKELAFQNEEKEKRAEELTRSKQLLDETGRLARVGGWEFSLKNNELSWSDMVYEIHEVELDYQPTVESAINFYAPESISVISEAVRQAIEKGKSFDIDLQLITANQNRIWVRAIGQAYRVNGEIVKIGGVFQDITGRKEIEDALHESQEKYSYLYETTPVGIYRTKIDGSKILEINNTICEMLGFTKEEFLSQPSTIRWADPNRRNEILKILKEHGIAINFDADILKKDGSIISCLLSMKIFKKEGYIEGFIIDISERKRVEEALKKSEERFRIAAETSNDVMYEWDLKQEVTWFGKIDEMLGYAPGEFPRTLEGLGASVHPEDWVRVMAAVQAHLEGRAPYAEDYRVLMKDGTFRWWSARGAVSRMPDGKPVRWIGTVTDITERKQLEAAQHESEERFRTLANSMPQLAWVAHADGFIYWYNRRWYEYTGTKPEQMEGWGWQIVHDPAVLPKVMENWAASIASGQPFEMSFPLRGTEGLFRTFLTRVEPWKDSEGNVVKWFGTNTDVETLKQTEGMLEKTLQNLEMSNKELEQFAYVASHDLQEPLRMVASYTQLLEKRYKDKLDQDANDFIQYAVDGANRMQKLIIDLLDYSRITSRGKDFAKIDISRVLGQTISNLQHLIIENTALITNEDLPELKVDESQILRVFQNLIENAIKFKKKSELPKIHISCIKKNDFYEFSVRDNGIGMDMQFHDRVFTIFQRLHSKEEYPGTGIGLSICKRIVERHGGKIWFESNENEGTIFYFTLKI